MRASLKRVGRVLATLGIQYKKVRGAHNRTSNPIYKLWAQTYVLQIHHALKEGHELVFLDESYAHENAAVDRTYVLHGDAHVQWLPKNAKGRRVCFINAISKAGFLVDTDNDGRFQSPQTGDIDNVWPTTEMIFLAGPGGSRGDYHGNFTCEIFMKWVENRLIPSLKQRFKDKVVCVVMDNAPHHCVTRRNDTPGLRRFNPAGCTKAALFEGLTSLKCKQLDVKSVYTPPTGPKVCRMITVPINNIKAAKKAVNGVVPAMEELREAATLWVMDHFPDALRNDVEAALGAASGGKWYVCWTVPYQPNGTMIEKAWAQVKGYAEAGWYPKRPMLELCQDLRNGMYTSAYARKGAMNVHGGGFAPDRETKRCEPAEAI